MRKIYLDMNVIRQCMKDVKFRNALLEANNLDFYYSIAHAEELAKIKNLNLRQQQIDFINELTRRKEIYPSFQQTQAAIVKEDLNERVQKAIGKDNEGRILTGNVEEVDRKSTLNNIGIFEKNSIDTHKINTIDYKEIFHLTGKDLFNSSASKAAKDISLSWYFEINGCSYTELKKYSSKMFNDNPINVLCNLHESGSTKEDIFELLMKYLNQIGYHRDSYKHLKKTGSATHDITHAFYASMTDYFVTDDKALQYRVKAVYYLLNLKTEVINSSQLREMIK